MTRAASPESLRRWNAFLGTPDCPCPTEYRGLGRLYGVSMGNGWVRMSTDPACPYHGSCREASEEIPDEPMYVVVQFSAGATARFRRTVYYAQGHGTVEEAEELAERRRLVAKAGGRHRDRYEVYELVKPGARESAYRAGREDEARPLQEVADAAIAWRAQFEKPADSKPPRMAALIKAVDRLINGQPGEDQDTPGGSDG